MANFGKIIEGTDIVLNCIPIVNTVNSAAQAIYKLAHKVDVLNPVAPGLKTSIKIHVLTKDNFDCFIAAIPILGNLVSLVQLVQFMLHGFDDQRMLYAVVRNDKEIVHLSLGNGMLSDRDKADRIFGQAAHSSNNEVFRQILNHRDDWSAKSLIDGLASCRAAGDDHVANANDILDYWTAHRRVLVDSYDLYSAIRILEEFLKKGETDLVGRILGILPDSFPFRYIQELLLEHSCSQYDYLGDLAEMSVLTEAHRNALIEKSARPSLEALRKYYSSVGHELKSRTFENYRETHFAILSKLLGLAQLQPNEIGTFIDGTLSYNEFTFIEQLVAKYEGQLTPQSKAKILGRLLPSDSDTSAYHQKRIQLFASWLGKWKNDVQAQAHVLYAEISGSGDYHVKVAECRFQMYPSIHESYPSVASLQAVNTQFKQILIESFPGCDQIPQPEAV